MKNLLIVPLLFFINEAAGQKSFRFAAPVPVSLEGKTLSMPFAGGINAAQIQQMDVNGNGTEELVLWDRNAENLLIFEKRDEEYIHNPALSYDFPEDIHAFLILADYDGDGKKDLFTASPFGIKVYKNSQSADGRPSWELAQDFLRLENQANLQVNQLDIPAILDMDGDGDLDILAFNFASGDFLEFYQNTSVERKGEKDMDGFALPVSRWGGFEFCSCENFAFGQTCAGNPLSTAIPSTQNFKTTHAGGHTLLLHDFNGDGTRDILMGQDHCSTLYYLPNEGSNSAPVFKSFSMDLPHMGPLPEFPVFHGAHLVDQDMLITTNSASPSFQNQADYSQSVYHYKSSSRLTTTAYLQEDMLDLGENTRPFFRGTASSGDLIVTSNSMQDGQIISKAFYFVLDNQGFKLVDNDYLGLSSLNLLDLQFQEYFQSDNRSSLFVSGMEIINFTPIRKLLWTPELTGQNLREVQVPEVSLRGNDHFEFFQHEGEDFMLLARQTGELIRYRVYFDPEPRLDLLDREFLGFADDPTRRNFTVHVISTGEGSDLYAVDQRGILNYLPDFLQIQDSSSLLLQLEQDKTVNTRLGRNTWMSSIPSAFGEGADLLLGNTSGGLVHLEDISAGPPATDPSHPQIKIFPNPTRGPVSIISSEAGQLNLVNMLGQNIWSGIPIEKNSLYEVDLLLSPGIYLLHFVSLSGKRAVRKIIINKM